MAESSARLAKTGGRPLVGCNAIFWRRRAGVEAAQREEAASRFLFID